MDPKLLYWTGALINMALVVALAGSGVRQRRNGDIPGHRRRMLTAAGLVGLFLASYALKVALLGREQMELWSPASIWVLRIHETCVLTMLLAGAVAGWRSFALARTRNATRDPADPLAPAALAAWHRRAGWVASVAAVLGLITAAAVLAGMYRRAGLL